MKLFIFLLVSLLLAGTVSARGDFVCPGGRGSRRPCSHFFPRRCTPFAYFNCYDPFLERGQGYCCPRRYCPRESLLLCFDRPYQPCFMDPQCPPTYTCCESPCGGRCYPPPLEK